MSDRKRCLAAIVLWVIVGCGPSPPPKPSPPESSPPLKCYEVRTSLAVDTVWAENDYVSGNSATFYRGDVRVYEVDASRGTLIVRRIYPTREK